MAGYVFGYKSPDNYWAHVQVKGVGIRVYRYLNGTRTLVDSGNGLGFDHGVRRRAVTSAPTTNITDGLPSGRVGFFTTKAGTTFDLVNAYDMSKVHPATDRAQANASGTIITASTDRLTSSSLIFKGIRLKRFEVTFPVEDGGSSPSATLFFNYTDAGDYDAIRVPTHRTGYVAPTGSIISTGLNSTSPSATTTPANIATGSGTYWLRFTCDGTTVTAKQIKQTGAPSDSDWIARGELYSSSGFTISGGQIGVSSSQAHVDDVTIKSDTDNNGTFETTEHVENFLIDSSGYASEILTYDAAGNLTYDGVFRYAYDAWNRLVTVTKGYRDSGGTLQSGSVIDAAQYDGLGRRTLKAVQNSADLDGTSHYYYTSSWQVIETRDGSDDVIRQQVWGINYIDELVQIGLNDDPTDGSEDNVETLYWAACDANYNITGIIESTGDLAERYEYTPYGHRSVFFSPGTNDPGCYAPIAMSQRFSISSTAQPYGINEVGHQGLAHEEETGLADNFNRIHHPVLARFLQRDPLGYVDGLNQYSYEGMNPLFYLDPSGLREIVITVQRTDESDRSTLGDMIVHVDGDAETVKAATLEPRSKARAKRQKPYAIPEGSYSAREYKSPKKNPKQNHRVILLDPDPDGFKYIEIHVGNFPKDTDGCIIVGQRKEPDKVTPSSNAKMDEILKYIDRIKKEDRENKKADGTPDPQVTTIKVVVKDIKKEPPKKDPNNPNK